MLQQVDVRNRTDGWWTLPIGIMCALIAIERCNARRLTICCGETPPKIARATVGKYANEAFPQWQMNNPKRTCPISLVELNDYMNNADGRDPWGTPYIMLCGATLPAGARGLAVLSFGPDRKYGTVDDIHSWE